jgi:hypothetical protein
MKPQVTLTHKFVEFIPEELAERTIYISIEYAIAVHKCCCGCGNKVVTPITPTDWTLSFDGETISLDPSIGNWSFPCQSHYWVKRNRVRWAAKWSREEIKAGRMQDASEKEWYYETAFDDAAARDEVSSQTPRRESLWQQVKKWFS